MPKWPIPELGSKVPFETLTLKHARYNSKINYWKFFRHSDELTGGYAASVATYTGPQSIDTFTETYLVPHVKESDPADFRRRVASAKPPRFVREGIASLVGVITQEPPNREKYPEVLAEWTKSVDTRGTSLQEWISSQMWPLVERYGVCYSLARRPSIEAANLAEQQRLIKEARLPDVLLQIITPENLPWWEEDDNGDFIVCRFTEARTDCQLDNGYPIDTLDYTRHWWITHDAWWYTDQYQTGPRATTDMVVDGLGFWNNDGSPMQYFPIQKWALKDERPPTEAAAFAQLAYFRKDSELDTIEKAAAYPMTWVPVTAGSDNPEETVKGPDVVGGWDPENSGGAKPMILETSGVSLNHFIDKRLPQLETEALSPYGRQREIGGNDSGVALAHIQQNAINIYRQHARHGSLSEFAALRPVAELLNTELKEDMRASWARKFGTLSDSSEAEILTAFWNLEPGDEFKKHILSKFAGVALADLSGDQLQDALKSWQSMSEEERQRELDMWGTDDENEEPRRETGISKPAAANPEQANGGPQKQR